MKAEQKYWFQARHYGWGWGFPNGIAGWLVLTAYGILVIAGLLVFPPDTARDSFVVYMICLFAVLIVVCWLKGQPPKWRWGKKDGPG